MCVPLSNTLGGQLKAKLSGGRDPGLKLTAAIDKAIYGKEAVEGVTINPGKRMHAAGAGGAMEAFKVVRR